MFPGAGEAGVVELEDEAGVDDGAILFAHAHRQSLPRNFSRSVVSVF
jgi:hypothetical protein